MKWSCAKVARLPEAGITPKSSHVVLYSAYKGYRREGKAVWSVTVIRKLSIYLRKIGC